MRNSEKPLHPRRLMAAIGLVALLLSAMACNRSRGSDRQTDTGSPDQPVEMVTAEPTLDPAAGEIEATLDALIEQLEGDDPLDDLDF